MVIEHFLQEKLTNSSTTVDINVAIKGNIAAYEWNVLQVLIENMHAELLKTFF